MDEESAVARIEHFPLSGRLLPEAVIQKIVHAVDHLQREIVNRLSRAMHREVTDWTENPERYGGIYNLIDPRNMRYEHRNIRIDSDGWCTWEASCGRRLLLGTAKLPVTSPLRRCDVVPTNNLVSSPSEGAFMAVHHMDYISPESTTLDGAPDFAFTPIQRWAQEWMRILHTCNIFRGNDAKPWEKRFHPIVVANTSESVQRALPYLVAEAERFGEPNAKGVPILLVGRTIEEVGS